MVEEFDDFHDEDFDEEEDFDHEDFDEEDDLDDEDFDDEDDLDDEDFDDEDDLDDEDFDVEDDYDIFDDEEDDFDNDDDYEIFDDEDDYFEDEEFDFDDDIDYDNLDSQSKEELDIFDEKPREIDSGYDINAVEIHISSQLTSQKIIQLMDTYPSLKRITCPQSIYNRISPKYIKALDELGVSIEIKYNWGKKKYSMTQINQVVDLFNEGKRSKDIASILDMSVSNVEYIKSKYFDKIHVKHYKRKYDGECRLKVKSMRKEGLKPKEISKELNIPIRSVYYILNKK